MSDEVYVAPPLEPTAIEGRTPGVVYHVLVRTQLGYVAARRIAPKLVRLRAERFDKQPLVDAKTLVTELVPMGFYPAGENNYRLAIVALDVGKLPFLIGKLTECLLSQTFKLDALPVQEEPNALSMQAALEARCAAHVKAAAETQHSEEAENSTDAETAGADSPPNAAPGKQSVN